jgi:hypothetical protein
MAPQDRQKLGFTLEFCASEEIMNAKNAAATLRATLSGFVFASAAWGASLPEPARRIQNQDAAFSLLLEAFREIQGSMIRHDYETRLSAADRIRDPEKRRAVVWMSDLERHLRQQKLAVQVERLQTTYGYARRNDERAAGITVANTVNLDAAAAQLRDFVVLAPDGLEPPTFADQFLRPPATPLAAQSKILREQLPDKPELLEAVTKLLATPDALPSDSASLLIVSWREQAGHPTRVVVQVIGQLPAEATEPVRQNRRQDELFAPVENWLRLLNQVPMTWLGAAADVRQRQRLFTQLQGGEATFLREQTVEPLHVAAVMTEPAAFLPSCLRSRVRALVITGQLTLTQWSGEVRLATGSNEEAPQIAAVLASWRALAEPVASLYVASELREKFHLALDSSQINAAGTTAVVRASGASSLCQRAVVKLMRWATEAEP